MAAATGSDSARDATARRRGTVVAIDEGCFHEVTVRGLCAYCGLNTDMYGAVLRAGHATFALSGA